jgi:hypothetical protein
VRDKQSRLELILNAIAAVLYGAAAAIFFIRHL